MQVVAPRHPLRRNALIAGLLVAGLALAGMAFHHFDAHATLAAMGDMDRRALGWATVLTLAGMAALGFYDVAALRVAAPGKVTDAAAWATGVKAYAISNMLGFAMITGGAVRFPFYRARGVDLSALTGVMAVSWAAFWLAVSVVVGAVLTVDDAHMAPLLGLFPGGARDLGIVLLTASLGVLAYVHLGRRLLRFGRFEMRLPSLPVALAQAGIALTEIALAAGTLLVLLPAGAVTDLPGFFAAYAIAIGVGILSHSPGGLGAFEATLLLAMDVAPTPPIVAALLVYRIMRFVAPFMVAVAWLAVDALRMRRLQR